MIVTVSAHPTHQPALTVESFLRETTMTDNSDPATPERPGLEPGHRDQAVTVLPLASWPTQESTLRVIADRDQQTDHSHRPVPPVAPGGSPYRYKVRLNGANAYACTADEVLAVFVDGHLPKPARGRDVELEQIRRRGEHCLGVIVNHVAQAILSGELDGPQEELLQRSAEFGTGRDPITVEECPRWDHPTVAMLLMGDLYTPEYGRFQPPAGRVTLLWPGRPERYLHDLAGLGLIALSENPSVAASPLVEIRGTTA